MAKSIRITDELYELATQEAALMERSLAQQIEHWVKLGVGVERQQAGPRLKMCVPRRCSYRLARDEAAVRSGRRTGVQSARDPCLPDKNARAEFPKAAFATRRKSW